MEKNDRYKRLVKFGSSAVILLIEIALYYLVWTYYYNPRVLFPFWRRGNWFMAGLYSMILVMMHSMYGGLRVGLLQKKHLIYSQLMGLLAANACAYLMLAMVDRHWFPPLMLIVLTGADMGFVFVWATAFQKLYNILFPPRELLLVYGERSVYHLLDKINSREDKYILTGAIHIEKGIPEIMRRVPDYGGVIIGDIPCEQRNKILKGCYELGKRVYMVPKISDVLVRSSDELNLFDTALLLSKSGELQLDQDFLKRILDLVTAGVLLLLGFPFFLFFGLAIKLEDHGPVFYRQKRLTKDGAVFEILKFRTMRVDAEADGIPRLSGKEDDRITRVGAILRATRLDELPQVFNILRGDMSMVGPRPERPEIAAEYQKEIPEFSYRLKVKAGLTGFAQIYGMYNTTPYDKLKLDLTYIRNASVLLDLKLIFMTPKIMFMKEKTEGIGEGRTTASIADDRKNEGEWDGSTKR